MTLVYTIMRWKKAALITVGIVLLLGGFAVLLLPGIVRNQAMRRVEAATGRKLSIGSIFINPFTSTVEIHDVSFSETGSGEIFASFSSARITASPATIYRRVPVIVAARINAPHFRIVRNGENLYNFTDLLKWLPKHPRLSVSDLMITNGSIDFIDRTLPTLKRHELRKVELAVPFITTMPYYADRFVSPRLSALLNGAPILAEGHLRPFPRVVEATANIELKDIDIPCYRAYFPKTFSVRVKSGMLSAKVAATYRAAKMDKPELALNGSVTLANTKLADRTGAPFLAVTRLEAEIARALLPSGDFNLSSLSADGLEVYLTRNKKGIWSHRRLVGKASPGGVPRRKLLATVAKTRLRNGELHFIDNFPPSGFNTDFKKISLDMQEYSTSPGKQASYLLSFTTARGEKGILKGRFSPRPLATSSLIKLTGVELKSYRPYFPRNLNVIVADGKVDGRLTVSLAVKRGQLAGRFSGSVGIRSLFCLDAEGKELLKWESLQLNRLNGTLAPFNLDIDDALLTRFYSSIVVEKDVNLNLRRLYTRKPENTATEKTDERRRNMVRIGTITMREGAVAFTDHHVTGGFSTILYNLGGQISGLSLEDNRLVDVDLRGDLENRSPLHISGQINPWRNELYADLKVSFANIELSPLTPYSGTYLGYAVDKGKLFLDSRYRIKERKLDFENSVVIDQLSLGRRIESDKVISPAVRLAVALLKDRKGEIRLDLPVTGRTDAPDFSHWHLVREILKNVLGIKSNAPLHRLSP